MEQALRNRLTYGPLMIAALLAMLYLDWWLEKTIHIGNIKPRGVGILILLLLILPPAVYELANLFAAERVKHAGHHLFHGSTMILVMILLVVKATDIGGFFGGRALGKHKLIFWLSPGKTWEGLIFGGVLGGIGQAGDLLESLMKRDAEVKDSGALVPGFGGILDIIDSPLLAAPFAYLMFSLF